MRFLALMVLALALVLVPCASADVVSRIQPPFADTVTLQPNDHAAFVFDLGTGELMSAEIAVESGSRVDVYFTTLEQYEAYLNPNSSGFAFYPAFSAIATGWYNESLVPPDERPATYVLIVDNTALWAVGSEPSGASTVRVNLQQVPGGILGTGLNGPVLFAIMALLMFACAAVGHLAGLRRGEARANAKLQLISGTLPSSPGPAADLPPPPDFIAPRP